MAGGVGVVSVVAGLFVGLVGILVVRYPQASYSVRTGWKHEDPELTDRGRRDQRLVGVILVFVGLVLVGQGAT